MGMGIEVRHIVSYKKDRWKRSAKWQEKILSRKGDPDPDQDEDGGQKMTTKIKVKVKMMVDVKLQGVEHR